MSLYIPYSLEDSDDFLDIEQALKMPKRMCFDKGSCEQQALFSSYDDIFEDMEDLEVQSGEDFYEVEISAHGYKPEEVRVELKTGDRLLMLSGKKEQSDAEGNVLGMKQFSRSFIVPEQFDMGKLKSDLSDGILRVTAPRIRGEEVAEVKSDLHRFVKKPKTTSDEIDSNTFAIEVDVTGYDPEDIDVAMHGNGTVIISAKKEKHSDEQGIKFPSQFAKSFTLPEGVNLSLLKSEISKDKVLRISAPIRQEEKKENAEMNTK